jgi:hypothetical protein
MQNYFTELANNWWYSSQCPWDRIALLAHYMPRIRDEVFGYADLWNIHTTRADSVMNPLTLLTSDHIRQKIGVEDGPR